MNDTQVLCASSHEVDWHSIDWAKCHRTVRRLQARIVKATQEGRYGKMKALQWTLTHSFAAKALAVRRVTENQGKNTPGMDGETWSTPEAKSKAIMSLKRRGYKPSPLRRVYIPKSNGKMRPLGIPTMKDRAMQALYLLALEPVAETKADKNSYGFRQGRNAADAIEATFNALRFKTSAQWILEGDIKSCFDNISHDWLLANIPIDKAMLQKWLKAGFIHGRTLFPTETGTPQGGIISPVLTNMTLNGLESLLTETFKIRTVKGVRTNPQVMMVRYADDFIITSRTRELLEHEVKPLVESFLKTRGLELSQEKTEITHIEEGFDFLGQNVRKYGDKLLIKPSKESIKAFLDKVRGIIKGNKTTEAARLIWLLNPVIRGWVNYHKHVVSKEVFSYVDNAIWQTLWQWAKRRHPKQGKRWIKAKYFDRCGTREWLFNVETDEVHPDGVPKRVRLFEAAYTPIRRHVKIKAKANPFDPQWELYFERRLALKMKESLAGRTKLLSLWEHQSGCCPVCHLTISEATGWNIHHITPRVRGGKDNSSNLVMTHPNCHRQIHSRGLSVAKPVPI